MLLFLRKTQREAPAASRAYWIAGLVLGTDQLRIPLFHGRGLLARSGFPASSVFPLMNIGVILFGTAASITLFRERLRAVQWIGIGCAIVALVLIIGSNA